MKTIFISWYWWLIPLVIIWLYIGRTTISFKPFRIHIEAPWLLVGVILITIGFIFTQIQMSLDSIKRAEENLKEIVKEVIDENPL